MSKPSSSTIAFVGLGNLGKPMALNLANYLSEKRKPALRVWNRTGSKSKAVEEASEGKAIAIDSLGEIARTCVSEHGSWDSSVPLSVGWP